MKTKWNPIFLAVFALSSCGPLSALSKRADAALPSLEACCSERLEAGEDVSACEEAFRLHEAFLLDWEIAYQTGFETDFARARASLDSFLEAKGEACAQ